MRTVSGPTDHVVVVGAGLSGLACALHLLGARRRVTVIERDAGPGGRAGRVRLGGYEVDTGPTVLTMPHLADEAFAAVDDSLERHVELTALHPAYRADFADGSSLDVHTDCEAMEAEVRRFAGPGEAAGYRELRDWLGRLYQAQMRRFIDTNFDSPFQLLHPDLAHLAALGGFGRLDRRIGHFLADPRLRRVFSFQALYAGVAPARALAAYAVIAYMDTVAGVWFPKGGCTPCLAGWQARRQRRVSSSAGRPRSRRWNARRAECVPYGWPRASGFRVTWWCCPASCQPRTSCWDALPGARYVCVAHRPLSSCTPEPTARGPASRTTPFRSVQPGNALSTN